MAYPTKGYLIAIAGITIWSTTGVFMGYLITHYNMPALLLAFWRNLLVCMALVPVLFFIHRPLLSIKRAHIRLYAFYGLTLALFNSIWTLSLRENGAAVATVLIYSSAGFTAIITFLFFQERLGLPKVIAILLSLGGSVMVANAYRADMWRFNPLGISTGLTSGMLFAIYTLFGKQAARYKINMWTSLLYSFAFGAFFIMIFNLFPALPGAAGSFKALIPDLPARGWLTLIFLSFVPTLLGYGLYSGSMNYLPASIANLLATTEPPMTALQAHIFLNERMTFVQILGSVIILSAMFIVQLERKSPPVSSRKRGQTTSII